jgi:hypothetical protein
MKRMIISKKETYSTRGGRYTLECLQCKKHFTLPYSRYAQGRGYFCSKHCKDINSAMKEKTGIAQKESYKHRPHPKGMLGKTAWNKGGCNYWALKEKNPNWNGGSSYEEYGYKWNASLRRKIRERDKHACQECGENKLELVIHHIDYDKQNNVLLNLITLCRSCHSKTNFNRQDWKKYFKAMLGC